MRSRLEHAVLVPLPVPAFLHSAVGVLFLVGVFVFSRNSLFCIPSVLFPSLASTSEWFPSEVFLKTFPGFRLDKKKKVPVFGLRICSVHFVEKSAFVFSFRHFFCKDSVGVSDFFCFGFR